MRIAIIDLGTNSVRFDVHQVGTQKQSKLLHREKLMVRLGQGVFTEGKLNSEAVRRTLHAFVSFKKTAEDFRVDRVIAFGTAALREASDGNRLLKSISLKTGIEVRVISGTEEAKLIALGILRNEKLPKERFGLIDIGGGSTEISLCRGQTILHAHSFSLGTARLQQVFLRSSPPKPLLKTDEDPVAHLRSYIRSALFTKILADRWPKVTTLLASSGTARALAKLIKKGKPSKTIAREDLKKLVREMQSMTTTDLLGLPGMESKRVDMILAGGILLEECMNATGAKKILTTEYSLRDGVLVEQKEAIQSHVRSPLAQHLTAARVQVAKVHPEMLHTDTVVHFAGLLFDRLKSVHRLPEAWKPYLIAAAYFHDVGEVVTPTDHDAHSYYFAKYADFAPLEKWESEFIAHLCLYHRVGKPIIDGVFTKNAGKSSTKNQKEKERKAAFLKLLALLRVADALDRNHRAQVSIQSVHVSASKVEIRVRAKRGSGDLELLRVEQKKALFEEIFQRDLKVVAQNQS